MGERVRPIVFLVGVRFVGFLLGGFFFAVGDGEREGRGLASCCVQDFKNGEGLRPSCPGFEGGVGCLGRL